MDEYNVTPFADALKEMVRLVPEGRDLAMEMAEATGSLDVVPVVNIGIMSQDDHSAIAITYIHGAPDTETMTVQPCAHAIAIVPTEPQITPTALSIISALVEAIRIETNAQPHELLGMLHAVLTESLDETTGQP